MPTDRLEVIRSAFARDYEDREDREKPERIATWRRIFDGDRIPDRVLEIGCNVGWNLEHLRRLGVTELFGIEPAAYLVARARARNPIFNVMHGSVFDLPFRDGYFDFVLTHNVLAHVTPESLERALAELIRVSRRAICVIEPAPAPELEVGYRDPGSPIHKRDHGAAIRRLFPALVEVKALPLKVADGFDDCIAHVFVHPDVKLPDGAA